MKLWIWLLTIFSGVLIIPSMIVAMIPNTYTIATQSMLPELGPGDIVKLNSQEEYVVGDVILFDGWRGRPVPHRIIMSYDGNEVRYYNNFDGLPEDEIIQAYNGKKIFVTKGDNNIVCDQCVVGIDFVTSDQIIGKVDYKIPKITIQQWVISSRF